MISSTRSTETLVLSVTTAFSVMSVTAESKSRMALNPATMVLVAMKPAVPSRNRNALWIPIMVSLAPFFLGGCLDMFRFVDSRYDHFHQFRRGHASDAHEN